MSDANKLLIRCAWEGNRLFDNAYGPSWGPGTCPAIFMPPSTPPSPPPPPPSPALPYTYTLMSDALSWGDADAACQAAGLQLATVQSAAQDALLLTAAAGSTVWIGGTDAASEGTWVWSPSNTPLSYTNWYAGEPNGRTHENCLMKYTNQYGGLWNDARCTAKYKYVCQTSF